MYFNVIEKRERLGFDDIAGVTYLYPSDNVFGTCASVAPIGGTSALAFSRVVYSWFISNQKKS